MLVLDEGEHMRQRKLLLPAFHGDRLREQRETMVRVARGAGRADARRPPVQPAPAHAGDRARGDPRGRARRSPAERERHAALPSRSTASSTGSPTQAPASAAVLGPDSRFVRRQHERIASPGRRPALPADPRPPRGRRSRGAQRRARDAAARARRGRRADVRRGDPRRARHADRRRSRDDRHCARLGLRAPDAPSRPTCAAWRTSRAPTRPSSPRPSARRRCACARC